jgi:thiol-disulfide isomerase/thioredoxin
MKRIGLLSCLVCWAAVSVPGQAQAPKDGITLQSVKYSGLTEVIHKNRGKVILVDFWADFCVPCKQGFPHVVELHKKHAKEGLAVVSVSLDPMDNPASPDVALKFLRKMGADFTNLYLNESPEVWQKKLGFAGPPCYYVFGREGKWTKFEPQGNDTLDYQALDRFIVERLGEKQ